MAKEIWKPITNYEFLYEVSNLGNIKSLFYKTTRKERILKPYANSKGYNQVRLCSNGKNTKYLVHRLVAFAFINNIENKPQINHINGVKNDNNINNLEWATGSENQKHAFLCGLNKPNKKKKI